MNQYPHLTPQEALAALTPEEGRRYVGIKWLAGRCRALLAPTNPYYYEMRRKRPDEERR